MAICYMATFTSIAQQDILETTWTAARPDGHAPISVMGDHMHGKGEWMFSYRYMSMDMDGLQQEANSANNEDALETYMVTATRMPMNMHMLGAMYAPSDKITLTGMVNVMSMEMDHITRMGGEFTTSVSGFSDIQLSALLHLFNRNKQTAHAQIGVSLPTGSVTEQDITPASAPNRVELPYPMQLGSGTFDTNLAFTYLGQKERISWGSQIRGIFRLGTNERDFAYGNRYSLNNWFAVKTADWLSFSIRLEGLAVSEIRGADPNLNPLMVITADTNNSGGNFIHGGIGLNVYVPTGRLKNLRFGAELASPLYQKVNGIQLRTRETFTLGTQYSF